MSDSDTAITIISQLWEENRQLRKELTAVKARRLTLRGQIDSSARILRGVIKGEDMSTNAAGKIQMVALKLERALVTE